MCEIKPLEGVCNPSWLIRLRRRQHHQIIKLTLSIKQAIGSTQSCIALSYLALVFSKIHWILIYSPCPQISEGSCWLTCFRHLLDWDLRQVMHGPVGLSWIDETMTNIAGVSVHRDETIAILLLPSIAIHLGKNINVRMLTRRASSLVPGLLFLSSGLLQIPKIVPTETPQSMLDEPSKGSKTTTYSPLCSSGTMIGSSCSSLTYKSFSFLHHPFSARSYTANHIYTNLDNTVLDDTYTI